MLVRLLLAAAVAVSALPVSAADRSDCAVTRLPDPPFIPPDPFPHDPPYGNWFWYGTDALWTLRPLDGHWGGIHNERGYRNKLVFWRKGFDWMAEPAPKLTITGRRLDGDAPPMTIDHASAVFLDGRSGIMTAGEVPTAGCWEVTAHFHGENLTYLVNVP